MTRWLNANNITAESYYSNLDADLKNEGRDITKKQIVDKFMKNEIKALVATVAFGMGFDKEDVGFVIHFQKPANLVAYYQQIGRAGRRIDKAYAVLLYGEKEDAINRYFIDSAFPTEDEMSDIVRFITKNPGLTLKEIAYGTNRKTKSVEKSLKYLDVSRDIYDENRKYYKSTKAWKPDMEKCRSITKIRYDELERMNEYCRTSRCYMEFIAEELDDPMACSCGKCSNCLNQKIFDEEVSTEDAERALEFIRDDINVITPRKQWPDNDSVDGKLRINEELRVETGRVLSNYGDCGWGEIVYDDKYMNKYFRDELVDASVKYLENFIRENDIKALTYIPSLRRPDLVKSFAERLARKMGLHFYTGIKKLDNSVCQKTLNTSKAQWENAYNSFEVTEVVAENTLLVDDMVDSKWTFTCCGYKLLKNRNGKIYPFALAKSSGRGD